jgi:hypothetical protein
MPSLPPRDGIDARICAGIRAGASTVSAVDRLTHVVGTSLPLPPTGEHDAIGGPSGIFLLPPRALCEHGGGSPHTRPHERSCGSMAPSPATTEAATPSPSLARPFLPTRSSPTHPQPTMGGSAALAACRALERSHQRLASTMSKHPGFADANPWVMEEINAVARELQFWYRRHSIRLYLARQTRRRLAATTILCWKRLIWLDCWFAQQALQHQKRLRLQLLCCGASAYAVSVRGDCQPPPTPTDKTSDPKVLRHLFPGSWSAVTTKEAGSTNQSSSLSPRSKASALYSRFRRFWRGAAGYAHGLLGCTNYGSIGPTRCSAGLSSF